MRDDVIGIGLMSGTSLDGISAAVARFRFQADGITTELLGFSTLPYSDERRQRLLAAIHGVSAAEYARLHFDLGGWLGDAAAAVLAESGVARADVRVIGSHGQTIWHEPARASWQLGAASMITERLGIDVVSDFRAADVAAGGQGAPLVPIADAVLFADRDHWRALQNIGGIGNVTVVPPHAASDPDHRGVRAFDTGPGVVLIDGVMRALYDRSYDAGGEVASTGSAIVDVIEETLREPYFSMEPPKSTGRELFTQEYLSAFIARCRMRRGGCTSADIVATAVALTARTVADAYRRFVPEPVREVVLSGGGARNPAIVRAIRAELEAHIAVRSFEELFFDGDAKEAVAFAFLAVLHTRGEPGNVPTATGARGQRILGALTRAVTARS